MQSMEVKSQIFGCEEIKQDGDAGIVVARFATFNVIDRDGDITIPGAFGDQKSLVLYHHLRDQPPLGRAEIYEQGEAALARLTFNLKMDSGREVFESVKMSDELQEYSYGYNVIQHRYGLHRVGEAEHEVRYLEKLEVHEISPVIAGAGINTGTVDIKSMKAERRETIDRLNALDANLEIRKRRALLLGV